MNQTFVYDNDIRLYAIHYSDICVYTVQYSRDLGFISAFVQRNENHNVPKGWTKNSKFTQNQKD